MNEHRTPALLKPSGIPRLSRLPVPRATRAETAKSVVKDGPGLPPRDVDVARIRSKPILNSVEDLPSRGPFEGATITGKAHRSNKQDPVSSVPLPPEPSGLGERNKGPSARLPSHGQDETETETETTRSTMAQPEGHQESPQENEQSYANSKQSKPREASDQRRPRPSLSERTIETLSHIPPSPSPRQRKSSFFTIESPMRPPSRPASALNLNRSRPTSGMGQRPMSPSKRSLAPHVGQYAAPSSASRRAVSSLVSKPTSKPHKVEAVVPSSPSIRLQRPSNATLSSATGNRQATTKPLLGSKTYSARSSKPRPSLNAILAGPPSPAKGPADVIESGQFDGLASGPPNGPKSLRATASRRSHQPLRASVKAEDVSQQATQDRDLRKVSTSSATLRKAIAEAKAARRAALQGGSPSSSGIKNSDGARADAGADVFHTDVIDFSNPGLLRKRVDAARTDGRLNIAAMGLKSIPEEVMKMYDIESLNVSAGAWYESVDLSRLIAADNEFEEIGDDIFPDVPLGQNDESNDEDKGNQFGGLETLDLHGNRLKTLPLGLRRLELLTTLNVSSNRLSMDCLEIITQISHLRELRCATNALGGNLTESVKNLSDLEVLDVHDNALTNLPVAMEELLHLRVLDVSGNRLASVPFAALASLPLAELIAPRNRLAGTLLPASLNGLSKLQTLDVSNNTLTSLTEKSVFSMPSLQFLNVSANRLSYLPDVSGWTKMLTLNAESNKLTLVPEGLVTLTTLKNIEFTSNSLSKLDDRLGLMDNLTVLRVANNPLRERRYLTMNTEDLKQALRERLPPEDRPAGMDDETPVDEQSPQKSSAWPVKAGGILDRSHTQLQTLDPSALAAVTATNSIRSLILHHNLLTHLPPSTNLLATTLTSLTLSHNSLRSETYLPTPLSLPHLLSLDLSSNTLTTLHPLLSHLSAPRLSNLTISYNRITRLPPLRPHFPHLTTLLASDNAIAALAVEAVKGLHTLDVARNDIAYLEPRLALLGAELKRLDVGGNRFKVPRYTVLDQGTEATLEWLRGRIPVGEEDELD